MTVTAISNSFISAIRITSVPGLNCEAPATLSPASTLNLVTTPDSGAMIVVRFKFLRASSIEASTLATVYFAAFTLCLAASYSALATL